jgi:NhaP-type Na+/H+ or K+/H+ antiporter
VTTDQILFGLGLTVALAVGSQVLAHLLRIPALIVLLPVGFTAGALTNDVDPTDLLGPAFQPLVSLSVALVLYDAGRGLDFRELESRGVVRRLIVLGVPITWVLATVAAMPLLGMSLRAGLMLGAILVVSGPTVVGPLMDFVRPAPRVRRTLVWEGSLVDPVGGILGALVFNAVIASTQGSDVHIVGQFLLSLGIGVLGAITGIGLLHLLLRTLRLRDALGASSQLAAVIAVAAACDIARDDTGLIAAIAMGVAVTNLPGYDLPRSGPFSETLVPLLIGLLFISISATVTPASLHRLILPVLGLVAVLVLVTRPLVTLLSTMHSDLQRPERAFVAWMAPRGIVAASTATAFGAKLAAQGVDGASKILPATFLVIVATVTVYGLTAVPVARRLGVSQTSGALDQDPDDRDAVKETP